jgi:hypothetical protein
MGIESLLEDDVRAIKSHCGDMLQLIDIGRIRSALDRVREYHLAEAKRTEDKRDNLKKAVMAAILKEKIRDRGGVLYFALEELQNSMQEFYFKFAWVSAESLDRLRLAVSFFKYRPVKHGEFSSMVYWRTLPSRVNAILSGMRITDKKDQKKYKLQADSVESLPNKEKNAYSNSFFYVHPESVHS